LRSQSGNILLFFKSLELFIVNSLLLSAYIFCDPDKSKVRKRAKREGRWRGVKVFEKGNAQPSLHNT